MPQPGDVMDWFAIADQALGQYSNIAKTLGALIVLAGLYLTYRRSATQERSAQTDSDRMKADVFTKAIDQLASPDLAVRIGGIYALERIAKTTPEYHWPIMETLTAYVRHRAAAPEGVDDIEPNRDSHYSFKRKVDVQAVITVLARRETAHETETQHLDLSHCFLGGITLTTPGENNLAKTNFSYSRLWWADLRNARLTGCNFMLASLSHAHLDGAKLQGANFLKGDLYNAKLSGADLQGASLNMTEIGMAEFDGATVDENTFLQFAEDIPQKDRVVRR